jgi:hypothetical protein
MEVLARGSRSGAQFPISLLPEWYVWLAWSLVVIAAAVGLGLASQPLSEIVFSGGSAGVIGGVALVLLAGAPTAARLRRDRLDPPGLYAMFTIVSLGLVSLAWLGTPLEPGPGLSRDDVATALRLVAVGVAVFGIGASIISRPRRVPSFEFPRSSMPSVRALAGSFILSLSGVGLAVSLHVYGYIADPTAVLGAENLGQVVGFIGTAGDLVVAATALAYFGTGERRLRGPLIVFILVQSLLGLFVGFKGTALNPITYVVLAYVVAHNRLPLRAIALAAGLAILFVLPVNQTYRQSVRGGQPDRPAQAFRRSITQPLSVNPVTSLRSAGTFALTRFRSIDSVALIVRDTPRLFPHGGGATYFGLPAIIVVPRAIWPGKPRLTAGAEFTHTYWRQPDRIRSSTQLTQIGDLYRAFGYLGVVLGVFLWGLVMGATAIARQRWCSPRAQLVYLYVVLQGVTYVESDLAQLITNASKTLPLVAILAWFLLPGSDGRAPGYRMLAHRPWKAQSGQ